MDLKRQYDPQTKTLILSITMTVLARSFILEDNNVEENSGVDFPGDSLEPFVGSSLTFDDHQFTNEIVLIEIASPKFVYRYED